MEGPLADAPEPPRKVYRLKPKAYERVNPPSPGETAPVVPSGPDTSVTRPSENTPAPPPSADRSPPRRPLPRDPQLLAIHVPVLCVPAAHIALTPRHARKNIGLVDQV